MQDDNCYHVEYECSECNKTLTLDDTSLRRISEEFERLGWLNIPAPGLGDSINYVVTCPTCAGRDEMLELDRQQQADNDYFLADTGRW